MSYVVTVLPEADEDIERLFDHLLMRELERDGDLDVPIRAMAAVRASFAMLQHSPFTCRKHGESSFLRELVIPFGRTGYVALFEILAHDQVVIAAVRHQREDDYH